MDETPDEYIARREGKDVVPYLSHTCMHVNVCNIE